MAAAQSISIAMEKSRSLLITNKDMCVFDTSAMTQIHSQLRTLFANQVYAQPTLSEAMKTLTWVKSMD